MLTMRAVPLRLGTPEAFAAVRQVLADANFTEPAICERLGIPAFTAFGGAEVRNGIANTGATPFDALVRLFLDLRPVPRKDVADLFGGAAAGAMEELGLIASTPDDRSTVAASVGLAPTRGLWLASDRGGDLAALADDVVYPAILENTQDFLSLIPTTPCQSFLDLGAGTGVAALLAARDFAAHAWACDITERSAIFAEFNRRLNGFENATIGRGDLYEPVAGLSFDRIVSHPPYVPVANPTCVFRDGGDDGEQIVRRIVAGLPQHLAPGGRFYALTLISDREGEPAEARVRRWLGEAHTGFDVAIIAETAREPFDFIGRAMQKGTHRPEELHYWSALYRSLKVKYLVYGCIVVQRHAAKSDPFTLRLQKGPRSRPAEAEWALEWNTLAATADASSILNAKLRLSPDLNMAVLHKMRGSSLAPADFMLRVQYPFESECKCPEWCAAVILLCDGNRTGGGILEELKQNGAIDPLTDHSEFAEVIRLLLRSGFLECDAFPAPPRSST